MGTNSNLFNVTNANFEEKVLKSPVPVIVDFWATWCPPCRAIAPVYEKLSSEYEGKLAFAKMDTDENGETSGRYGIRAIPTMLVFKNGEIISRMVGPNPAALKRDIDKILSEN
jgi:thioredoxin 1